MILCNKQGTNPETKLLEIKHMSRPIFFYLGLPNSVLKPVISNVFGLPLSHEHDNNRKKSI